MSKHTPGPWRYDPELPGIVTDYSVSTLYGADVPARPITICDTRGSMGGEDTGADARLMAAAPVLLETLESVLGSTELNTDELEPETRTAVRKAAWLCNWLAFTV